MASPVVNRNRTVPPSVNLIATPTPAEVLSTISRPSRKTCGDEFVPRKFSVALCFSLAAVFEKTSTPLPFFRSTTANLSFLKTASPENWWLVWSSGIWVQAVGMVSISALSRSVEGEPESRMRVIGGSSSPRTESRGSDASRNKNGTAFIDQPNTGRSGLLSSVSSPSWLGYPCSYFIANLDTYPTRLL